MIFTASFTDLYGNVHTDAVIELTYATLNTTTVEEFRLGIDPGPKTERGFLDIGARYWLSQQKKDEGWEPMVMKLPKGKPLSRNYKNGVPEGTLFELAQDYIERKVLPKQAPEEEEVTP